MKGCDLEGQQGPQTTFFFYTTITQSHTTGFQYRMCLSMLNAGEKIATPPDVKIQKPLHGKKGNIYPQLLKCSLYISNKKLRSLVSADLGWFKFTTYHFKYLKCSPIILPTPTQTSCSYHQSNYFCIFHFIPLAKIPFISSHVLTYVYPLPPKSLVLKNEKRVCHDLLMLCLCCIRNLTPVTQLYVSVDASTKESLKKIDRPLFRDFWSRFLDSLKALSEKV